MQILAIETSCDETALALVEAEGNPKKGDVSFSVLSNVILSQVKLHAEYGGVYPSLAKREHAKNLIPLLKQALEESNFLESGIKNQESGNFLNAKRFTLNALLAREPELLKQFLEFIPNIKKPDIDAIAVTYGPGLEPALWVGINFAKALSLVWNIPVIPINHMEGHIFSALLQKKSQNHADSTQKNAEKLRPITYNLKPITFPLLALLISGGHTELVLSENWLQYKIVGETRDDAVGEAFDKVARMLELPYPGGPAISEQALKLRRIKNQESRIKLPRPMINSNDFNFSFSGLKTAVLYRLKEYKKLTPQLVAEFAHEFQEAVTEVVVKKTIDAAVRYGIKTIVVGGGVSANQRIRDALIEESRIKNQESRVLFPSLELTGDNALMIAIAGYIRHTLKPARPAARRRPGETCNMEQIKAVGTLRLS